MPIYPSGRIKSFSNDEGLMTDIRRNLKKKPKAFRDPKIGLTSDDQGLMSDIQRNLGSRSLDFSPAADSGLPDGSISVYEPDNGLMSDIQRALKTNSNGTRKPSVGLPSNDNGLLTDIKRNLRGNRPVVTNQETAPSGSKTQESEKPSQNTSQRSSSAGSSASAPAPQVDAPRETIDKIQRINRQDFVPELTNFLDKVNAGGTESISAAGTQGEGAQAGRGSGLKRSASDALNAGLGINSLIKGALNKKAVPQAPTRVSAPIRPAQGDEEGLSRKLNDIAQQTRSATSDINRATGADVGANIAARLGVQANANNATDQAVQQNSDILRQDQNRVEAAKQQEAYTNNQLDNQYAQQKFEVNRENEIRNRIESNSQVNSALNYEVAREADMRNKTLQERLSNSRIDSLDAAALYDFDRELIRAGFTPEQREEELKRKKRNPIYGNYKTVNYQK